MKNSNGFGAIEAMLIIVMVAILGFVGFKAYENYTTEDANNSQLTAKNSKNEQIQKEKQPVEDVDNEGYIVIDKWDVKFPATSSRVEWTTNNSFIEGESVVFFHSVDLEKYEGCGNSKVDSTSYDLGILSRSKNKIDPEQVGSAGKLLNKFGEYYYYYVAPQSICYEGRDEQQAKESGDLQSKLFKELEKSLEKIESI